MSPHLPLLPLPNFVLCSAFQTAITAPPSSNAVVSPVFSIETFFSLLKTSYPLWPDSNFLCHSHLLLRTPPCFCCLYSQVSVMLFASKVLSSNTVQCTHPIPSFSCISPAYTVNHFTRLFTRTLFSHKSLTLLRLFIAFTALWGITYSQNLHPSPAYSLLSIIVLAFMAPFKLISPLLLSFFSPAKLFQAWHDLL